MSRILIIARVEFLGLVRTKGFIIGLLMAPLLLALSIGFQYVAVRRGDVGTHRFAVIDHTGVLYDAIDAAAAKHNTTSSTTGSATPPQFIPERIDTQPGAPGADIVSLSGRVRSGDLFGFVEIPANVLDAGRTEADQVSYYTETPSYTSLPQWLGRTLQRELIAQRFGSLNIDPKSVSRLTRATTVDTLNLVEQTANGSITQARKANPIQTFALPFGMMYLLFLSLMTAAPQLLTAIVEEKMSRISEVLLGSVSPIQLMAGKLIGVSAVSAALAIVYLAAGVYAAAVFGVWELVRFPLIGWFGLYLICAVLIFGSVFMAIGAACSDLKDAQALMQYLMMFLLLPVLAAPMVLQAPNGALAVTLSLWPTATPFLMLLRLAMTPAPPLWQVALSATLTLATAALCAWAAARIFRIGLLMQGKAPNLPELLRWIRQ